MKNIDIGIDFKTKEFVAKQLNVILADHYVLFTKLNKYHWNIKGPHFGPLHELFEKGYKMLFENFDKTAERIVQLDFEAIGTLEEFIKYTHLSEEPLKSPNSEEMLKHLIKDFAILIIQVRELLTQIESIYKDGATANFLADFLEQYEKYNWILKSHLL